MSPYITSNATSNYLNSIFTRPTYSWTTSATVHYTTDCTGGSSWIDNDYIQKVLARERERKEREARRQEELLSSFEEVFA